MQKHRTLLHMINKVADQFVHQHNLTEAFVISLLESIIAELITSTNNVLASRLDYIDANGKNIWEAVSVYVPGQIKKKYGQGNGSENLR